ncbi:MAG TPA: MgtC/SapB family protein [Anaerolineales bacterium]|jgi:putative Mg2+ transporter-C (MgtC) family protein|nr:MgtC/SapB family protein [Anaerolineales bacterium]
MDMNTLTENLIRVGFAVVIGGLIGAEREFRDKAAGFRTIILITVGSALFTIFSTSLDPGFTRTRIAANIVTGIGFLGAGAIVREHGRIGGLTTAATIWLAAALGMGIGAGELVFVAVSAFIVIIVLLVFPRLEIWIDHIRESRTYKIVVSTANVDKIDQIHEALDAHQLTVYEHHQSKSGNTVVGTWSTIGSPKQHEKFSLLMVKDKDVEDFVY